MSLSTFIGCNHCLMCKKKRFTLHFCNSVDSVTNKEKWPRHLKNTYTALTCVQIWARRGGAEACQLKSNRRTSLETKQKFN